MTDLIYMAQCGALIVWSLEARVPIWTGYPMGRKVYQVQAIPGTSDAIVVLEPVKTSSAPSSNLIRWRSTGEVVWQTKAMDDSRGYFRGLEHVDAQLITVYHNEGFIVTLDTNTGRLESTVWTK